VFSAVSETQTVTVSMAKECDKYGRGRHSEINRYIIPIMFYLEG